MSDPIIVSAATGVASGLATVWSMEAVAWIKSYFNDHHPSAVQKAQKNTSDFLIELSNRVMQLESKGVELKNVLEDPEFSSALQKAVIASSETESKEKHQLLAEVLANRLKSEAESRQALLAKMSLNIIPFLTPKQIELLSLIALFHNIQPVNLSEPMNYQIWIIHTYFPYLDIEIDNKDILYLESLACVKTEDIRLKVGGFPHHYDPFLRSKLEEKNPNVDLDPSFYETSEFQKLEKLWIEHIHLVQPTSVGSFIAINTLNLKEGSPIPLTNF